MMCDYHRTERRYTVISNVKGEWPYRDYGTFKSKVKAFECARGKHEECIVLYTEMYNKGDVVLCGYYRYDENGDKRGIGRHMDYHFDKDGKITWVRNHSLYNMILDFDYDLKALSYVYNINMRLPFSLQGMYNS